MAAEPRCIDTTKTASQKVVSKIASRKEWCRNDIVLSIARDSLEIKRDFKGAFENIVPSEVRVKFGNPTTAYRTEEVIACRPSVMMACSLQTVFQAPCFTTTYE